MLNKWWLLLIAVFVLSGVGVWTALAQTGAPVNPIVGSVWTYLGPTFGASWMVPDYPRGFRAVLNYGAKCDGVTDDIIAINNGVTAIADAGGGALFFPGGTCIISAPVQLKPNVKLVGQGHLASVLAAASANLVMVNIIGSFSGIEGMMLKCGGTIGQFLNTSGNCLNIQNNLTEIYIRDFELWKPFDGIVIGNSTLVTIKDGYIYSPTPGTGRCIAILGGNNQVITNVFCRGAGATEQPNVGLNIRASGGVWLNNYQTLWGGTGVYINPQAGEAVTWIFDTHGTYDSNTGNGIAIAPNGGVVRSYYCIGCWTSTNQLSGVAVIGTANDDVHFIGHRSFNNQQHGVVVTNGNNFFLQNSSICGNSAEGTSLYDGIHISDVDHVLIQGNVSGNCAGFSGAIQHYGINISGALTNQISVTGNRLSGNQVAGNLAGFGQGNQAVIKDNLGLDDQLNVVATASTINLPLQPMVVLSGTTNVQNMTGGWQGRSVWLLPQGVFSFVTGGTLGTAMGNGLTTEANRPVLATYVGTGWYFVH